MSENLIDVLKSIRCFTTLSTSIENIHGKFDELQIYIDELNDSGFQFSIICLHETWLSDNDDASLIQLNSYYCIAKEKHCSKNVD